MTASIDFDESSPTSTHDDPAPPACGTDASDGTSPLPTVESVDAAIDRRLESAVGEARASAARIDRHAFLAAARVRRNLIRRTRRVWTIATPIAAAIVLAVAVGVAVSSGQNGTTHTRAATSGKTNGVKGEMAPGSCPTKPGQPNTAPGEPLFEFTPTALTLCTYGTDGTLVGTSTAPDKGTGTVTETLRYIRRSYVDEPTSSGEPDCSGADTVPIDRAGVIATDTTQHATVWIAVSGCTTLPNDRSETTTVPGAVSTPNGPATTTPSFSPRSELDSRCPTTSAHDLPTEPAPSNPLLDFAPTNVLTCTYELGGDRRSVRINDPATIQRLEHDIAQLHAPPSRMDCTDETSSTLTIIATNGTGSARIWAETYGCGYVSDGTNLLVGGKSLAWATDGR